MNSYLFPKSTVWKEGEKKTFPDAQQTLPQSDDQEATDGHRHVDSTRSWRDVVRTVFLLPSSSAQNPVTPAMMENPETLPFKNTLQETWQIFPEVSNSDI